MSDHPANSSALGREVQTGAYLVVVEHISKSFGEKRALADVLFTFRQDKSADYSAPTVPGRRLSSGY